MTSVSEGQSLRAHLARSRVQMLVISVVVLGMFLSAVIVPYAFSDDYSILWMAVSGEPSPQFGKDIFAANATGGRPLGGLMQMAFYTAAGTIGNLRFVRLFGVLGIVALGVILHWGLVRSGIKSAVACLIAIFICSLPAFQVYAAWTIEFEMPSAMLLASAGSLVAVSAIDGPRHLVLDRLVGACALLVAALLVYQPAAMFFWVFLAVALVGGRSDPSRAKRLVRAHAVVAACAFVITYVAITLMIHLLEDEGTAGHRSELSHDVAGKARWFVEQPLYQSLNVFKLAPTHVLALFVAGVATAGIVVWLIRNSARPFFFVVIGLILIPLTYLPNLVVEDTWPPFRTQAALSSLIALYLCLGALGLWVTVRDWLRTKVATHIVTAVEYAAIAVSIAFVGLSVVMAATHVQTLIVEPQMTELRVMRTQVKALPLGVDRVAFPLVDWSGGLITNGVYDEFGLPTSARPWAVEPAVYLILREQQPQLDRRQYPFVDVYGVNSALPPGVPAIDLRSRLVELRG